MTSSYLNLPLRSVETVAKLAIERKIRNDRLAVRTKANSPWPIVAKEETGRRVSVRCPMPLIHLNTKRRNIFEQDLIHFFGGFTSHSFQGGWRDDATGETMVEKGRLYDVSGRLGQFDVDLARSLFMKLGLDLGQSWVHVEVHHFDAMHGQVNPAFRGPLKGV